MAKAEVRLGIIILGGVEFGKAGDVTNQRQLPKSFRPNSLLEALRVRERRHNTLDPRTKAFQANLGKLPSKS
ncbi:MAG: hypothetical protein V1808_03595 [Candidatus Daviesbacteria bacterium]